MTVFGPRATPRYVLHGHDGETVAGRFAAERDWDLIARDVADPDRGMELEVVWATDDPVTFQFREDHILNEGYVYLAGRDRAGVERHESDLTGSLDLWSRDELLREAARHDEGPARGRAILRAGLGAPMEFDREFYDLITGAMRSGDPAMRAIGVRACAYSPVAEYRPALEGLARSDAGQEIRDLAQATLRAFDEFEVGS
ncbi:hypothetical protein [Streptomyces albipurpureus]|uniref:HEAT repeat domain-containing protein n=1 Tax=Streptomyces albipurpureus TaxID=2897419 RepID=A0ABT0UIN2_9ACTN|nr:hypothetical protein [Streptomyces sp. CWNU-1]MCM2387475.1 hypothetical protein [Streptomyces sp. CWNU-1]